MIDPIKEEEEFQKKQLKALEEHLKEARILNIKKIIFL